MSEDFKVEKNNSEVTNQSGNRVIDEAQYKIRAPRMNNNAIIGRGGDPLYKKINATKEQLDELLEETATVQDWVQKETCNNAAIACLENENLKEVYFEMKDGFGEYGPIMLMGFKTPQGIEIPRLKVYDKSGEVIEVLTGPLAIDELNKRALAFKQSSSIYEVIADDSPVENTIIEDYQG